MYIRSLVGYRSSLVHRKRLMGLRLFSKSTIHFSWTPPLGIPFRSGDEDRPLHTQRPYVLNQTSSLLSPEVPSAIVAPSRRNPQLHGLNHFPRVYLSDCLDIISSLQKLTTLSSSRCSNRAPCPPRCRHSSHKAPPNHPDLNSHVCGSIVTDRHPEPAAKSRGLRQAVVHQHLVSAFPQRAPGAHAGSFLAMTHPIVSEVNE
ncbi:hypothetical protein C2E23DRAFT_267781 [Lenzites betulinus]|nr:hypothetical protein C2E23DRAFT_267781 [Lenzites betulinus]